jgi:hypothetical protein
VHVQRDTLGARRRLNWCLQLWWVLRMLVLPGQLWQLVVAQRQLLLREGLSMHQG